MSRAACIILFVSTCTCMLLSSNTAMADNSSPYVGVDGGIVHSRFGSAQYDPIWGASVAVRAGYPFSGPVYLAPEIVGSYQHYFQKRYAFEGSDSVGIAAPDYAVNGLVGFRVGTKSINSVKLFAHFGIGRVVEDTPEYTQLWDIGLALDIGAVPIVTPGIHVSYNSPSSFESWVEAGLHIEYAF